GQYRPGYRYEPAPYEEPGPHSGVGDAAKASALTLGPGALASRPAGSIGTFVGRRWAEGRAANGGPSTGKRVFEMADVMQQNGLPEDFIRRAGKDVIARGDDPALGDFHLGNDGEWKLEISDRGLHYPRGGGPTVSTVGRQVTHPDL